MKVELKQIIDELTDAIELPKGYKVSALVDDNANIVGWTVVSVSKEGEIKPINDCIYKNIKELIGTYK